LNHAYGVRLAVALVVLAACEPPGYGRHMIDAAAGSADAPPAVDAAPDSPPVKTCDHAFRLDGHATSQSVWLTGDFVKWAGDPAHGAVAFTLGIDGGWTGSYSFMAGTFQYKFIVDGTQWIPDPTDPNTVPDGFGGTNSVYACTP
jgi:hypothetical protein